MVYLSILAIAFAANAATVSVSFTDLIKNPDSYRGKRISVVGVAEVDGISFTLFEPPRRDVARCIFVAQRLGKPRYNHLDNHWVKVTGTVDTDDQKIFAGKIFLERVEALPRAPVQGAKMYGIFLNDGPASVEVELFNKSGNEGTKIPLGPGDIEKTVITEGAGKISEPTGKLSSRFTISSERSSPEFFDSSRRTFYFRIKDGKVVVLRPSEARPLQNRWDELQKR